MKKYFLGYCLVVFFLVSFTFFAQRIGGRVFQYEAYRAYGTKEELANFSVNLEDGVNGYEQMVLGSINSYGNPRNFYEKYTFEETGTSGFDAHGIKFALLVFVLSFPMLIFRKVDKGIATTVKSSLGSIFLMVFIFIAETMYLFNGYGDRLEELLSRVVLFGSTVLFLLVEVVVLSKKGNKKKDYIMLSV